MCDSVSSIFTIASCPSLAAILICIASGFTPLVAACLKGDLSEVGLLLSFSADPAAECDVVDTKNGLGAILKEFPLSIAAREGHEAIVKMLLTLSHTRAWICWLLAVRLLLPP